MNLEYLQVALDHAGRGWPVIPLHAIREGHCTCGRSTCDSPGKHPRLAAWPTQATTDERTIRSWFARWRALNLGIVTGANSGLVGLDVDGDMGAESLRDLERQHGALPETVVSLTGRGGRHFLFRHPCEPVPNAVGLWPGIDVRGDGGYLVVPPSRTVAPYVWQIGSEPGAVPIASLPAWLLDHLRRRDHRDGGGDRLRADGSPLVLREGERNRRLFQIGAALRRYGLGEDALRGCLEAVNRQHVIPPLETDELATIAASAGRYPPARLDGDEAAETPGAPADEEIPWLDDCDAPPPGTLATETQNVPPGGQEYPLFVRACELSAPPITWCVEGLVADRMLHILSGKDKRGKTLLALEVGRAVLRGTPLFGSFATRPGAVMAALLDDPLTLTLERLERLGVRGVVDNFYVVDPTRVADPTAVFDHLVREAPLIQPAIVILDALYLFLPDGREAGNDAARMRPLMVRLNRLVEETGAAVLVVAHDNKSGSDVAGSYVVRAMAKAILRLALPAEPSEDAGPDESATTRRVLTLESKLVAAVSHVLDLCGVGDWRLLGDPKAVRSDDLKAAVLRRVQAGPPGTAEDIARSVSKRRAAVETVLTDLVRAGSVHEAQCRTGRRGPTAHVYGTDETLAKLSPDPASSANGQDGVSRKQRLEGTDLFDRRGNSVPSSVPRGGRRDGILPDAPDGNCETAPAREDEPAEWGEL